MRAEIMMIGTELLLGQIEDTNATFIAQELAVNGIDLYQKTTVGDNPERICDALTVALERSDIVICSGGLGPTEDDLTKECVAKVYGQPLEFHEEIWEYIESLFARYRFKITENNKRQAMVPAGGEVIHNPNGTAPGLWMQDERGAVVCMPGVPHELKAMLTNAVIPHVRDTYNLGGTIHYRVLKVCALGESRVDAAIGDLIQNSKNPTVGVLANPAFTRIRIAAKAESYEEAERLIDEVDAQVRERLPGLVMGVNEDTLESVVDQLLTKKGWKLTLCETVTGGMLAQRFTAAKAESFVGGTVETIGFDEVTSADRIILDKAKKNLIDYEANCALAIVADPREGHAVATFVHPDGETEWAFGRAGIEERLQLRTCVVTLENLRQYLIGL